MITKIKKRQIQGVYQKTKMHYKLNKIKANSST